MQGLHKIQQSAEHAYGNYWKTNCIGRTVVCKLWVMNANLKCKISNVKVSC